MSRLVKLTARTVETAQPGTELRDSQVPGLRLRVSPKGLRRFVFVAYFPGQRHASRRALSATTLLQARDEALSWRQLVRRGIDPHEEQERQKREELRKRKNTFLSVLEAYCDDLHRRKRRSARMVERDMKRELLPHWGDRPISTITRGDVTTLISAIRDRGAPAVAHNTFSLIRALFVWAVNRGEYGLEHSPCGLVRPSILIGERKPRARVLSDDELCAFWRATANLGYPSGALLRMLLLTGQRRREVGSARWNEFDFNEKVWTIPAERFKADASHAVPLTGDVLDLLLTLPRFSGDRLFTTDGGKTSVNSYARLKDAIDAPMLAELRERDPGASLAPWVLHDLRRTVRTRLSSLRVPDTVAEMVIGHGRKGLQRVYDQHSFIDEMREALEAWNARLRAIANPPPANVVNLVRSAQ
jgi:integrase